MPFLEGLQHGFAADILHQQVAVADVSRNVIGTGFKSETITLIQGDIDIPLGPPAPDGILLVVGARPIRHLIVLPDALIDLHHGFRVGVVVAPIRSHTGGAGVRSRDSVELLQVSVKHLRIGSVFLYVLVGQRQARQRPDSALRKDHVAVPFRILNAALVGEHGTKLAGRREDVRLLLDEPPEVLAAAAIIVIAATYPVQIAGVEYVPPLVENRAIVASVARYLTMPVKLAANDMQVLIRTGAVVPQCLNARRVRRVNSRRIGPGLAN